jgi:hypothetical protein
MAAGGDAKAAAQAGEIMPKAACGPSQLVEFEGMKQYADRSREHLMFLLMPCK